MRLVFSFAAAAAALAFPAACISETQQAVRATHIAKQAREVREVRLIPASLGMKLTNPYPRRLPARLMARLTAAPAPSWPAHHALWTCLAGYESHGNPSNDDTGHNGHYGYLQMHPGWGYGTSYYASDDSQLTQETAAETAYRVSGYSRAWLEGQWGQTIGPCWGYA